MQRERAAEGGLLGCESRGSVQKGRADGEGAASYSHFRRGSRSCLTGCLIRCTGLGASQGAVQGAVQGASCEGTIGCS